MKHFTIVLLGLFSYGCGVSAILQCGDDVSCINGTQGSSASSIDRADESSGGPDVINGPSVHQDTGFLTSEMDSGFASSTTANPFFDSSLSDASLITTPQFDPFLMSIFGLEDFPVLLSQFFDNLLIDALTPAGTGSSSMTFLERLCIAGGDPEFLCRQRYGR